MGKGCIAAAILLACLSQVQGQGILCIMTHCLTEFTQCSLDPECMSILNCLGDCKPTDAECSFTCGMGGEAGKNPHFVNLLKCMVANDCMDKYAESGECLATDAQALDITDYDQVRSRKSQEDSDRILAGCWRLVDRIWTELWAGG